MYPRVHLYLSALLLLTIVAFWPSYFSKMGEHGLAAHLHGITATAWMLMLIAQTWLASRRKFATHRKLGKTVYGLAPLFVLGGFAVVYTMVANDESVFYQTWGKRLAFFDSASTLFFIVAVTLAIRNKSKTPIHARWMLATVFPLIMPVVTRLRFLFQPLSVDFGARLHLGLAATELLLVWLVVSDWRKGITRSPFAWALALTLVQHYMVFNAETLGWWVNLTDEIAELPLEWLQ